MIWGMYLPRGIGPYGPYGEYEGSVDVYGDGWTHRLRKYGHEELSDEQKVFYGDAWRYPFRVAEKFMYECGHKQPGPDDRIVRPIEEHEPPRFFQTDKSYKELSSIISLPNRIWAVDEAVKAIIGRMEPGIHHFYPIEIRMPRGRIYPVKYYILVVGTYLDCSSFEDKDKYFLRESKIVNGVKYYSLNGCRDEVMGLAFHKSICENAHLWRDRAHGINEWLLCFSGELETDLRESGLKLPKYYRMKEV